MSSNNDPTMANSQEAANTAADSFPDTQPSPVTPCGIPGPKTPTTGGPPWTVQQIKDALKNCDGGTGIWDKAKAANGGKDPTVVVGSSAIGSGGSTDTTTGTITLDSGFSRCNTIETLVMELSNLSHKSDFDKIDADCPAGNLSREAYIKANEKVEYDGVQNSLKAEDACVAKWGCSKNDFSFESMRGSKDFDDYYDHWLANNHKEYYGKAWDTSCKAAYDAKQAAAAAASSAAPAATGSGGSAPSGGGCFIATAAYGSALAPEVQFLRSLRDDVLRRTRWGHRFFEDYWSYYYQISPRIAARMDADPDFKRIMRWSIVTPMVNYLKLAVKRPSQWNLDGLDAETADFIKGLKRDMDEWLAAIELPESFSGMDNQAIIDEINIAADLVLKDAAAISAYLGRLVELGELPLLYSPEDEAGLLAELRGSGRSRDDIDKIMYGSRPDATSATGEKGYGNKSEDTT